MKSHLSYVAAGAGPTIVLIHGFAADSAAWAPQIAALSTQFRVVAPDLRGFGASPSTRCEPYLMEQHASDVVALLDDLGVDTAFVCGASMGGYVALAIAHQHPSRVRALVLANTRATPDSRTAVRQRLDLADRVAHEGLTPVIELFIPKLLRPDARPAELLPIRNMLMRQSRCGTVSALLGMAARPDHSQTLAALSCPLLILTSDQDQLIPTSASRTMATLNSSARLIELAGAGHLSNLERPDDFTCQLRTFLNDVLTRQRSATQT